MNRKRKKDTYDKKEVGIKIKTIREFHNLTQVQLAEKTDRATKYISDIERGNCGMSLETVLEIAKILNISLDYLFFEK